MKTVGVISLATLLACLPGTAQSEPFDYRTWKSKDGKTLEARLCKLEGDTVTLQVKKGGKRYSFKRSKLAEESNSVIERKRRELGRALTRRSPGAGTIYQAAALGLRDKAAASLKGKRIAFNVSKIRINSDRVSAYLDLGEAFFFHYVAPPDRELFKKDDVLYHRPKTKARTDPYRSVNKDARRVTEEGGTITLHFLANPVFEFDRVGVTDGVIMHQ